MIRSTSLLLLIGQFPSVRFFYIGVRAWDDVYGFHFTHVSAAAAFRIGGRFDRAKYRRAR